jgi:hypothetical protein
MPEITQQPKRIQRKPKFRIGQVVSVRSFYGNFTPGQTGPGFAGKQGWRHGFQFGKVVKIMPIPPMLPTAPFCYFLDGWTSALTEDELRPVTQREIANGKL